METLMCVLYLAIVGSVCPARIGGGKEVKDPKQFPFFAMLRIPLPEYPILNMARFCGGTLIHPSWVLTAGHCLPRNRSDFEWVLQQRLDMVYMGSIHAARTNLRQSRSISGMYRHPNYKQSQKTSTGLDGEMFNNIALLKLSAPFQMSETVNIIQLSKSRPSCEYGIAIGMGRTIMVDVGESFSLKVKYTELLIEKTHQLSTPVHIPSNTLIFAESEISQMYQTEVSGVSLWFDSGGPFICANVHPPIQIGVLSFVAHNEGAGTVRNGIERVDLFGDFIAQHVADAGYQKKSARSMRKNAIGAVSNGNSRRNYSFVVFLLLVSFIYVA